MKATNKRGGGTDVLYMPEFEYNETKKSWFGWGGNAASAQRNKDKRNWIKQKEENGYVVSTDEGGKLMAIKDNGRQKASFFDDERVIDTTVNIAGYAAKGGLFTVFLYVFTMILVSSVAYIFANLQPIATVFGFAFVVVFLGLVLQILWISNRQQNISQAKIFELMSQINSPIDMIYYGFGIAWVTLANYFAFAGLAVFITLLWNVVSNPLAHLGSAEYNNIAVAQKTNALKASVIGHAATKKTYTHHVKKGDTLNKLAEQYGTTIKAIQRENGFFDTTINIGDIINITTAKHMNN